MSEAARDEVVGPIVVGSDDGVALFTTLGHGEAWMEGIDVEDGVYGPAFDAVGHRVAIGLGERNPPRWLPRRFWGQRPVELTVDRDVPPEPEALAALLRERLGSDERDLAALLDLAVEQRGITC